MAKSNALKFGILGAFTGLLDAKISDWKTRLAEEAEMRKQARLEQLLIERENRAETRAIASEERANDRWFDQFDAQQAAAADARKDTQEHEVALTGLRGELGIKEIVVREGYAGQRQAQQIAAQQADAEANRQTQVDIAMLNNGPDDQNDGVTYVNQTTGERLWVPRGQVAPQGFTPEVGYGSTFAPSQSKSNAPATTPRPGAGRPAAPRDWSKFSGQEVK